MYTHALIYVALRASRRRTWSRSSPPPRVMTYYYVIYDDIVEHTNMV